MPKGGKKKGKLLYSFGEAHIGVDDDMKLKYKVGKFLQLPTAITESESNTSMGAGNNAPQGVLYVPSKGKLYAACAHTAVRFNSPKTDLSDITSVTAQTGATPTGNNNIFYVASKDKIYISGGYFDGGFFANVVLFEVDPAAWTVTIPVEKLIVSDAACYACTDGTYFYLTSSNTIHRFNVSDYAFVSSLSLVPQGIGGINTIAYDGSKLFITNEQVPAKIARIDPGTFTVEDSTTLPPNIGIAGGTTFYGDYIFCGMQINTTQTIVRVNKSVLSDAIVIDSGAVNCYGIYTEGTYIWTTYNTTPGKVVVTNPHNFQNSSVFTMSAGDTAQEITSDDSGNYYVIFYTSPGATTRFAPSAYALG